jgi:SAM-dependent methyltransferase
MMAAVAPTSPELVADRLRRGLQVDDDEFDAVYPPAVRELSRMHWSPVDVARRATELLTLDDQRRVRLVLDVGSGAGKMCLIGGLLSHAVFVGIEQRSWLVAAAREAAHALRTDATTTFLERDALEIEWDEFDGIYLFNPFHENIDNTAKIDSSVPCNRALYSRALTVTRARLLATRARTRVVTYQGFGGEMPDVFRLLRSENIDGGALELWERR